MTSELLWLACREIPGDWPLCNGADAATADAMDYQTAGLLIPKCEQVLSRLGGRIRAPTAAAADAELNNISTRPLRE